MTDTNSLRTGAGYALEVGLYATHMAMTEAADTIDALRAENERLRACFDWANGAAEEGWLPAQEVRKLRAQLVEAQRDAELDITDADSALEEVAALRDEHERLKNDGAIFYEAAAGLLATNDTLRAQLAEAQMDSKRLDWIDKQTYAGAGPRGNVWMVGWKGHSISGIDFRAAIDIAKGEQ